MVNTFCSQEHLIPGWVRASVAPTVQKHAIYSKLIGDSTCKSLVGVSVNGCLSNGQVIDW